MSEHDPGVFLRYLATFQDLTRPRVAGYRRYFLILTSCYAALLCALGVRTSIETFAGAVIISAAALLPWWLWASGRAKGLPIWPIFTLTAIWAYALPLVSEHPIIVLFPPAFHLTAAVSVTAALGIGTLVWWPFVRQVAPTPPVVRVLPLATGKMVFWVFLVGALVFNVAALTGSFGSDVQGFTILRGVVLGIAALAVFYFGYQHGVGSLAKIEIAFYLALVGATTVVTFTSMLLVNGMTILLTLVIAYMLGRGRIPWRTLLVLGVLFYFLHAGKSQQRDQYWGEVMWRPIALSEYPMFFLDWAGHSTNVLLDDWTPARAARPLEEKVNSSLWERSSLMHLFLYFQYSTGTQVPYLWGLTYSVIPELLIPRVFHAEKARAHFGNNVLAVHYGIVDNTEDTVTSVGFGFLNEAYANFGLIGTLGVAGVLGAFFGWVTRLSMSVPLMSFRFLFAVSVLGSAFQVEYTAGVFVSSLFQSTMALVGVAWVFMSPLPIRRAYRLLRDVSVARPESPARGIAPLVSARG